MPLFVDQSTIKYFNEINVEVYELFFIPIRVFYRDKQEFDRVYGEDINILFKPPVAIPAYIPDLAAWKNIALRYGLDETRDLIVYFSLALLNKYGFEPPNIGDRIEVQKELFEIRQTNLLQYESNLQIPMSHVCQLHKVRPEIPPSETTVASQY